MAERLPELLDADDAGGGQAKVANLDVVLRVDEDVDGLEVAVDHALRVDVHQALADLAEHPPHALRVLRKDKKKNEPNK